MTAMMNGKKYVSPSCETVRMESKTMMKFSSGWNVDGEHQGGVEEGGDLEWGEND